MTNKDYGNYNKALAEPDSFALRIVYQNGSGIKSRRYISPLKKSVMVENMLHAQCLCSVGTPNKVFMESRISEVELIDINSIEIPMEEIVIG